MVPETTKQLFPYGSPVTGPSLVGREEMVNLLLNELNGGQHVLLPGPRRTGKSSVILECLTRLSKQGVLTGYVDLSAIDTKRELASQIVGTVLATNNTLFQKLLLSVTTRLKDLLQFKEFKAAYNDFEVVAELREPNVDENEIIDQAFDFLEQYAQKKKKHLVLAFDEFGEINAIDPLLIPKMRAKFQLHKKCTYIFTGSQESILKEMFSNPKEPFFGFTKLVTLPPIDAKAFAKFIQRQLKGAKIKIDPPIALSICTLMNTHPFYTMVLANSVFEHVALNRLRRVGTGNVCEGYKRAFLSLKPQLEALWHDIGKRSRFLRQVCHHLATTEEKIFSQNGFKKQAESSYIAQALKQLENKGIILKTGSGKYAFTNIFFRDYVLTLSDPAYFENGLAVSALTSPSQKT